jgi:hypothetical protein
MVETITEIMKYLIERSESISRYSDKLREALERIESQFGEKRRCRICGIYTTSEKDQLIYANAVIDTNKPNAKAIVNKMIPHDELFSKYADILDDANKSYAFHKFVPSIDVDIDIKDTEPFFTIDDKKYYLAFRDHNLVCIIEREEEIENTESVHYISSISREALKALVKSGRLIKFLNYVAEELKKKEQEFKEISEMAEKMAQATAL